MTESIDIKGNISEADAKRPAERRILVGKTKQRNGRILSLNFNRFRHSREGGNPCFSAPQPLSQ